MKLTLAILAAGIATVAAAGYCNTRCQTYGSTRTCTTTCYDDKGRMRTCVETCHQYGTQVSCTTTCY